MQDTAALAFAHPSERAAALSPDTPRDRISMTEHQRDVEIGAFQQERGIVQRVQFDVVVEVATRAETAVDDVDRILSYDTIVEAIDAALAEERINLLETLAARIADRILTHPKARRVFVRIGKLDRGPYVLGVEIIRDSSGLLAVPNVEVEDAPQPIVIFLSHEALQRSDLTQMLDHIEAWEAPAILCVDLPDGPRPDATHDLAQRRIDLLAIEQAAWVLAARDKRCIVVDSRTELDWAMRHDRISVWAPSKLVLDAHEGDTLEGDDPLGLAIWLADDTHALELVVLGGSPRAVAPDLAVSWLGATALPTTQAGDATAL